MLLVVADSPSPELSIVSGRRMIYRNWSLLTSTMVIWGGVATVAAAQFFLFGGKEKFQEYLCREGERLRQQDRALMADKK